MADAAERLQELVENVRRGMADAELDWLRHSRLEQGWQSDARRLLGDEGRELRGEVLYARAWNAEELRGFAEQVAYIAYQDQLAAAAPSLAGFHHELLPVPTLGLETPAQLIQSLSTEINDEGRALRARPLGDRLDSLASRLIDARSAAAHAWAEHAPPPEPAAPVKSSESQLRAAAEAESAAHSAARAGGAGPAHAGDARVESERRAAALGLALPRASAGQLAASSGEVKPLDPGAVRVEPAPDPLMALEAQARELLAATDDAARDMVRWLTRSHVPTGTIHWHALLYALRAKALDGLAKPARRYWRLATGLRRLGFERDMNSRLRGEPGRPLLHPAAHVVVRDVPHDLRIAQSPLDHGVLSDLLAVRGIGEALALALVSPAVTPFMRWPVRPGVPGALGTLLMQLRADRGYLGHSDEIDPLIVEQLARHAGVIVLLDLRLQAALWLGSRSRAGDGEQRLSQLAAASERALAVRLPAGLAARAWYDAAPDGGGFAAASAGLAAHVGLRERFDEDWYRNPRVAEVIRGACARGGTLSLTTLCDELGVTLAAVVPRAIELLG
jgi:hypothetical protein